MSSKNTLVTLEASVDSIVSLADPRLPYEHSLEIIAPNAITPKLTSNISDLMSEGFEEIYWSKSLIESEVVSKECLYLFMIRDSSGQAAAMTTLHRSEKENKALLHWLVVGEAARQKGLGTALMYQAGLKARQEDFSLVTLRTESYRTPAIRLYKNIGFRPANQLT